MARYTELFAEWIEAGGELPTVFDGVQIEGEDLSSLFIAHFCDREIGFETPTLFNIKLQSVAAVAVPELLNAIERKKTALKALTGVTGKERLRTGGITRNYGEKKRINWDYPAVDNGEYPYPEETAQNVNTDAAYSDGETYDSIKDVETGLTPAEGETLLTLEDKESVLKNFYAEFDGLFMQIF